MTDEGVRMWYSLNKLHRTDGLAIEEPNGSKKWYVGGKRHRVDGPAIERDDGSKEWYMRVAPF